MVKSVGNDYWRARIALLDTMRQEINELLRTLPAGGEKRAALERLLRLVSNGVFEQEQDAHRRIQRITGEQSFSKEPLRFAELCTYNTFFGLYPHKVCGQQVVTSSREFPVTVKGTRAEVEAAIRATTGEPKEGTTSMNLLELEALALETELALLDL